MGPKAPKRHALKTLAPTTTEVMPDLSEAAKAIPAFDPQAFAPAPGAALADEIAVATRLPRRNWREDEPIVSIDPSQTPPHSESAMLPDAGGGGNTPAIPSFALDLSGMSALQANALKTAEVCAREGFAHWQALSSARCPFEMLSLQADFFRRVVELIEAQSEDFLRLTQGMTRKAAAPLQAAFGTPPGM